MLGDRDENGCAISKLARGSHTKPDYAGLSEIVEQKRVQSIPQPQISEAFGAVGCVLASQPALGGVEGLCVGVG